jgi:hypothetical protein
LDLIGLVDNINDATTRIDYGRKGFAIRGKEQEGRISYEMGIAKALSTNARGERTEAAPPSSACN